MVDAPAYTREALVRDLIRAISAAEGKPISLGASTDGKVDRAYIGDVADAAVNIVNRLTIKTS
jgi:hypothetical protein